VCNIDEPQETLMAVTQDVKRIPGTLGAGLCASLVLAAQAWAGEATPAGLWRNVDDVSGKSKALIRITEADGELQGRIEKLLRVSPNNPNPRCSACTGERKDQPIVGMTFLWGFRKTTEGWSDGQILDPDNGKVYKSRLTLSEDGRRLDVRGYIGVPLLGRSQVWLREE
jgi:uncharacterized protein (DUF2147 family)